MKKSIENYNGEELSRIIEKLIISNFKVYSNFRADFCKTRKCINVDIVFDKPTSLRKSTVRNFKRQKELTKLDTKGLFSTIETIGYSEHNFRLSLIFKNTMFAEDIMFKELTPILIKGEQDIIIQGNTSTGKTTVLKNIENILYNENISYFTITFKDIKHNFESLLNAVVNPTYLLIDDSDRHMYREKSSDLTRLKEFLKENNMKNTKTISVQYNNKPIQENSVVITTDRLNGLEHNNHYFTINSNDNGNNIPIVNIHKTPIDKVCVNDFKSKNYATYKDIQGIKDSFYYVHTKSHIDNHLIKTEISDIKREMLVLVERLDDLYNKLDTNNSFLDLF